MCYDSTKNIPGYYFDSTKFSKCHSLCKYCTGAGTDQNPQCTTCSDGLYLVNGLSLCYGNTATVNGYYYSSATESFEKCNAACKQCNGSGTSATTNCIICADNYFPLFDNMSQCYLKTATVNNYYFDSPNNEFNKCYANCNLCSNAGDDTNNNCLSCNSGFYSLEDNNTMCYPETAQIDGYFFDIDSSRFSKCYSTCKTCSAKGTVNNHQCLSCNNAFYPLEDSSTQCYSKDTAIQTYFFDTQASMFRHCFSSCLTCTGLGDETLHNCSQCLTGFYSLADDSTKCFPKSGVVEGYYFSTDTNKLEKCYDSCSACSGSGDKTKHNCTKCLSNFYNLVDDNTQCFTKDSQLEGYYFNTANNDFEKCFDSCSQCSGPGDTTKDIHQCLTCRTDFYNLEDSKTQCYSKDASVQTYFFDMNALLFKHCYNSCLTCTEGGDDTKHNCSKCQTNFFNIVDDNTKCFVKESKIEGYYFNTENNDFEKCFDSCSECSGPGDSTTGNHQCLICKSGFYTLEDANTYCFSNDSALLTYFFDKDASLFKHCYSSCMSCTSAGDDTKHNCSKCQTGFFNLIDDNTKCFAKESKIEGYYFNTDNNDFEKCFNSCSECSGPGDSATNSHQCISCKFGFYSLEDNSTQCFSNDTALQTYFFDTEGLMFKHCYSSCSACTGAGDDTKHNCSKCLTGFYNLADDATKCFAKDSTVEEYFLNSESSTFDKCFNSCSQCSKSGDLTSNNCTKCKDNFFPLEDSPSQCRKGTDPLDFYVFDTDKFSKCYKTCKTCGVGGSEADNKCFTCIDDFVTDKNKPSNCVAKVESPILGSGTDKTCYNSCKECSDTGTVNKHLCTICKDGYVPLSDDQTMCYLSTSSILYYFLDGDKFSKCYDSCMMCKQAGDQTNNNCTTCKDGFAIHPLQQGNCTPITSIFDGYTYDTASKSFVKCYDSCSTCSKPGSSTDHNCLKCKDSFYMTENNSNCYAATDKTDNYFFDSADKTFKQCYKTCKYCSSNGTDAINNCTECAYGFKQDPNNSLNCILNPEVKCYASCSQCSDQGNELNHNCTKCALDYYPIVDLSSQCYKSDASLPGYFYDNSSLKFQKCDGACKSCSASATSKTTNCSTCAVGFVASANDSTNCVSKQTSNESNDNNNSFNDKCYKLCANCTEKGTDVDHKCTTCIDGYDLKNVLGKNMCIADNTLTVDQHRYNYTMWLLMFIVLVFI
jgi:hypothetical protein